MDATRGAGPEPGGAAEDPPPDGVRAALESLAGIGHGVELSGEEPLVLQAVAEHAVRETGAMAAGIAVLEDGRFEFGGFSGDPALRPALSYPADHGTLAAAALRAGQMLRLDPARATVPGPFNGRAVLIMPLMFRGSSLGLLGIVDHGAPGRVFPPACEARLEACAAIAALVLASRASQRDLSLRRSIVTGDRDRARWALELQAGPLQHLAALKMALARLRRNEGVTEAAATIVTIERLLADTVREVREVITDLHPAALDDLGLVPALEAIVQRVRDRAGLAVELETRPPARRLTPEVEAAVCSVVNTGLRNVVMHAHAETVEVFALDDGDELRVEVCDDGVGFPTGDAELGESLLALRERLALVGGTVIVGEQPGGGVRLRALIPVAWRAEEADPLLS